MCRREKSLSILASSIPIYPQILVNVHVLKPKEIDAFPKIKNAINKAGKKLKSGRILVRPSGTEPKVRVMVEGDNMDEITTIAEEIAEVIKSNMK